MTLAVDLDQDKPPCQISRSKGAVQAECNGSPMPAAQGTTVTDCCIRTPDIARRQHLRSAGCRQLFVPPHWRSMLGRRAFSVAGLELVTRLSSRSDTFF